MVENKAYGICSKESNAMKSDNPKSGFYEAEISRTLDTAGGSPQRNQGGIVIVSAAKAPSHGEDGREEGETPDAQGTVWGIGRPAFNQGANAKFSFTIEKERASSLVAQGPGAVAHPVYTLGKVTHHTRANEGVTDCLAASDYKDPQAVIGGPCHIVRRLTPLECGRLQGFPDGWCEGLETPAPTGDELVFWRGVFEAHRKAVTHAVRPKSDEQIARWLKDPRSDAAEYRMWGNGVALPCVFFVLSAIAGHEREKSREP